MTAAEALLAVVTLAAALISGLADLDSAWRRGKAIGGAIGQAFKKNPRGSQAVNLADHQGRRHPKKTCQVSQKETRAQAAAFKKKACEVRYFQTFGGLDGRRRAWPAIAPLCERFRFSPGLGRTTRPRRWR
jgi:hypothetical protein